jgi:hypothetical protein
MIEFGIIIEVNFEQMERQLAPNEVIEFERIIEIKFEQ